MSSEKLNEYFASEARDYLDQLDHLLGGDDVVDSSRLVRLATAVRGSMDMAGAESIAQLAGRLEQAARSVASSEITWSDELRDAARQTTADLVGLVRNLGSWGPAQDEQVGISLSRWAGLLPDQPVSRPIVSIEALYYDDSGPHILFEGTQAPSGARVVPIQELLLRGEAAFREALELRPAFEAFAHGEAGSDRSAAELVDELFELLLLSRTPEVQEA